MKASFFPFFSQKSTDKDAVLAPQHLAAYQCLGKPMWSDQDYSTLVRVGYQQNVIVYRCVELIAKSLAGVPWLVYETKPEGDYELTQHPLLDLLRSPNARQSGCALVKELVSQLLLSGNAYLKRSWPSGTSASSAKAPPNKLKVLRPDRVRILVDREGRPMGYEVSKGPLKKMITFDRKTGVSDVLHLKMFHPTNDWYGMSPLEAASHSIDQHNAVGDHNLAILQNGGRPSGALIIRHNHDGQGLNPQQRDFLKRDLQEAYAGARNAGKILVVEGNCEWKEMGLSPRDLDFYAGRQLAAREIAQAFGVPTILIGLTEDATHANYREARLNLWEETLLPLLDYFMAELNRWLVPSYGGGLEIRYDRDAIPALAAKREHLWETLKDADFLTLNEKRQMLGFSPLEDTSFGQGTELTPSLPLENSADGASGP